VADDQNNRLVKVAALTEPDGPYHYAKLIGGDGACAALSACVDNTLVSVTRAAKPTLGTPAGRSPQ
jgi:hypothetical protein